MAAYLQIVIICRRLSSFSHVSGLNIIKRYEDKNRADFTVSVGT